MVERVIMEKEKWMRRKNKGERWMLAMEIKIFLSFYKIMVLYDSHVVLFH